MNWIQSKEKQTYFNQMYAYVTTLMISIYISKG